MTLAEFVATVDGFVGFTQTDKIRIFAWYLHFYRGMDRFKTGDIVACFDSLHLHRPSNPSQFIRGLVEQKQLIKDIGGHRLAKRERDAFDVKYGQRAETVEVDRLLSELPAMLPSVAQREYLREALVCFRHKAFRAAVVMTWNVVFDHLITTIAGKHVASFNSQMSGMFGGKKKPVATKDDFQKLKESEVIEVCNAGAIISKEVAKTLSDRLDKRNSAAHPSGSTFDKLQAEAYISDLIKNAMMKIV